MAKECSRLKVTKQAESSKRMDIKKMGHKIENTLNCEHLIIYVYCENIIISMSMVTCFYGN